MNGSEGQDRERLIIACGSPEISGKTMSYLQGLGGCFNGERKPSTPKDYSN